MRAGDNRLHSQQPITSHTGYVFEPLEHILPVWLLDKPSAKHADARMEQGLPDVRSLAANDPRRQRSIHLCKGLTRPDRWRKLIDNTSHRIDAGDHAARLRTPFRTDKINLGQHHRIRGSKLRRGIVEIVVKRWAATIVSGHDMQPKT